MNKKLISWIIIFLFSVATLLSLKFFYRFQNVSKFGILKESTKNTPTQTPQPRDKNIKVLPLQKPPFLK